MSSCVDSCQTHFLALDLCIMLLRVYFMTFSSGPGILLQRLIWIVVIRPPPPPHPPLPTYFLTKEKPTAKKTKILDSDSSGKFYDVELRKTTQDIRIISCLPFDVDFSIRDRLSYWTLPKIRCRKWRIVVYNLHAGTPRPAMKWKARETWNYKQKTAAAAATDTKWLIPCVEEKPKMSPTLNFVVASI